MSRLLVTLLNEQGSDKGIELLHGASRNLRPPTLRLARTPRHARSNCAQLALPAESIRLGRIDAGRRDRGSRVLLHGGSSATVHFASFCPDDRHCSKVRRHAGVPHLRSCPGRRREHLRRHPPSPPHAPPAPRRSTRRLKRRPLVAPPRVTFPNVAHIAVTTIVMVCARSSILGRNGVLRPGLRVLTRARDY